MKNNYIKFEKYDTVKIVCIGDKRTYKGLFIEHSEYCKTGMIFGLSFTGPHEIKIIKGSQRGTKLMFTIWNMYGIKIMPTRMVLLEKMKGEKERNLLLDKSRFEKSPANGFADY